MVGETHGAIRAAVLLTFSGLIYFRQTETVKARRYDTARAAMGDATPPTPTSTRATRAPRMKKI